MVLDLRLMRTFARTTTTKTTILKQRLRTAATAVVLVALVLATSVTTATTDEAPRFIVEPESRVVKPHSQVVLKCRAEPESAGIRWRRDGEFIDLANEKDMFIEGGILRIASFKHRPKEYSHIGVYQCVASSPAGTIVSQLATLERAAIGHFEVASDIFVNSTEGNVALIPCHPPHGHPTPITMFEVNNTLIERTTGRHKILPSGNLQIEKVRQSDQGIYRCTAYNTETGMKRVAPNRIHLRVIAPTVNSPTRIIKGPQGSVEVIKSGNLTLECVVEGSPVPVVTWEKYGGQLPEGRYTQVLGNLVIERVEMLDQGTYICRANNDEGIGVHTYTGVEVLEPPVIREAPHEKMALEGTTVSFHCAARNNEQIRTDTRWLHNGRNVYRDSFISITETALTINNVQMDHGGMYQCVAHNKLGMSYASARLQVKAKGENISEDFLPHSPNEMQDIAPDSLLPAPSPTILQPPSNTTVAKGASIALPCTPGDSSTAVEVTWHKDGKPVTPSEAGSDDDHKVAAPGAESSHEGALVSRYKIGPSGSLQIFNVKQDDRGQFTCIVSNAGGIATATAYLTVSDPLTNPPRPEDLSKVPPPHPTSPFPVVTTSTDARRNSSRNWGRGDFDDNGYPRQRGDRTKKKKGNRRRGKKKDRSNRPTEGSRDTKLVPPSKPEVSKLSDTSVMLKWTVPANDGLTITFFKVQYKAMSGERAVRGGWRTIDADVASDMRMHEVSGLRPGGTYRFRVLAVYSNNDNKQGPNSKRFTLSVEPPHRPRPPGEGPVIVEARPQVHRIAIRWQYLPVDQSPIEGFVLFYKPFQSTKEFKVERLLGPNLRLHELTGLEPDTQYTLKLQCFNLAGNSDFSNQVVKKTLATDDIVAMVSDPDHELTPPSDGDVVGSLGASTTEAAVEYQWNEVNSQKTNALLYMVLGIVLGLMTLTLVVFMVLCGWKQRQQRRMMAALNANIRKFEDPSKAIYADSVRKKQLNTGGFMLNGITPVITNGHVHTPAPANGHAPPANGHIPNYTLDHHNRNSKVHISINPMDDLEGHIGVTETHPMIDAGVIGDGDAESDGNEYSDYVEPHPGSDSDSHQGQSLAELRSSLQDALHPPPPPGPAQCCGDPTLGSMDRRTAQRRSADSHTSSDTMNRLDHNSINTNHRNRGEHAGDPPEYSSIRPHSPDQITFRSRDRSKDRSHDRSSDVIAVPYRTSQDYIPLSDRAQESLSTFTRSHDQGQRGSRDQLPWLDQSQSQSAAGKQKRRRRRHHRDQSVRDMATNTDLSSNEGTLDHRHRRSRRSMDGLPQDGPGGATDSPAESPVLQETSAFPACLPGDELPPYTQPYTDLPRVLDYPPSPDDDEPEV